MEEERLKEKLLAMLAAVILLIGGLTATCAKAQEDALLKEERVQEIMSEMSLHEKVCQLFFVRPEDFSRIEKVTDADAKLMRAFERFPVGGVILFPVNMKNAKQLLALNQGMQEYAKAVNAIGLFIGVDEEGGGVARVAKKLRLSNAVAVMSEIGETNDPEAAYEAGSTIGTYLKELGFTLDFAPVADVRLDVKKPEITLRSFGFDAKMVSQMVSRFVSGIQEQEILSVLKHFPGHGSVSGNSHNGVATSTRTVSQWKSSEWLPFQAGIDAGAQVVLMSHQLALAVDADFPSSLSYTTVTELLRGELGFDKIVITDALRMDSISNEYGSGDACVQALLAGCDMLLLPTNFTNGYNGVMKAVEDGRLTQERIDESVKRILLVKLAWGLVE